mgnify:CR=1 FL=1
MNREQWLQDAVEHLTPVFKQRTGLGLPDVHVSVGWPSKGGTSAKKRVIGQCWPTQEHGAQIFISPLLDDAFDVLAVLVHELVHALHPDSGHRGDFISSAREMGLVKPWTASTAGEDLEPVLTRLILEMGEYPHHGITPGSPKAKPQSTRMRKVTCPNDGYLLRTTAKWLELGVPTCFCGTEMEVSE